MANKRQGYKPGYHPTPEVLLTVKRITGTRKYADLFGNTYTQRAVQEARNGYVTIERARDLRATGFPPEMLRLSGRKNLPLSVPTLARRWEKKNDQPRGSALNSTAFRRDLARLVKLAEAPAVTAAIEAKSAVFSAESEQDDFDSTGDYEDDDLEIEQQPEYDRYEQELSDWFEYDSDFVDFEDFLDEQFGIEFDEIFYY